jgi:hypothetical protein
VVEFEEKRAADQLLYITLHVFHHDVECLEIIHVVGLNNFDDFNNRWVIKFSQQRHFAKDTLAVNLVVEDVLHSLDSNFFTSGHLDSATDTSIRSSA